MNATASSKLLRDAANRGYFSRSVLRVASATFLSLTVALSAGVLVGLFYAPLANAADKADKDKVEKKDGPKVSAKVGKPLQAAIDAINKKEYAVALLKLGEADAVDKKTPYDQFQIDEIRAYAYTSQSIVNPEVISIFEKSLATPEFLPPGALGIRLRHLSRMAFDAKDFNKAIELGNRQMENDAGDMAALNVVALSHYNLKDYKSALALFDKAIATKETAGVAPDEQWLRLAPACASQLGDNARYEAGFAKLVRYFGKAEYWDKLLTRALDVEKNDAAFVYIFRLMSDVGTLSSATSYMEYADRAMYKAMPNEALLVLEAGFEKKILGVDAKDKVSHQQKLADAKRKAQADKAQLPELEKELANSKATTGQLSAGLGLAYYSFGMSEQAIAALDGGLKKGGLKNTDDYRMALGIAQLRTGQKEAARATFQSIPSDSSFARVANLWAMRSYN